MDEDILLLCRFVRERDEQALATLIQSRIDFVYATALREVRGDVHLAEDVVQSVFLVLVQKAALVAERRSLVGWLYNTTRLSARAIERKQRRWRNRELEANAMRTDDQPVADEVHWRELSRVIDDAMDDLEESDREAVLLRYFDHKPYSDVATRLGVRENAARMRVDRALDRLRAGLSRRGIVSSAAALGTALSSQPIVAAPVGLTAVVGTRCLTAAGAVSGFKLLAAAKPALTMSAVMLALGLAVHLPLRARLKAQIDSEASAQIAALSAMRAGNFKLKRDLQAQEPVASPPARDPLGKVKAAASILEAGLLGPAFANPWFTRRGNFGFEAGFGQIVTLLDLPATRADSLVQAARSAQADMVSLVRNAAPWQRNGNEISISIPAIPAAKERFDGLLAEIAGILGPDGYRYFQQMGGVPALEEFFSPVGLIASELRITRVPESDPRYNFRFDFTHTARLPSGSTRPLNGGRWVVVEWPPGLHPLGLLEPLLPSDFVVAPQ